MSKNDTSLIWEIYNIKLHEGTDGSTSDLTEREKAVLAADAKEKEEKDDFKPHMMYDPKTGKGHEAKTMEDHLRMKKMGYDHGVEEMFSTNPDDENYDTVTDLLDQLVNAELDNGATELPVAISNLISRLKAKLPSSSGDGADDDIGHLRGGEDASIDPDYNKYM